MTVTMDKAGRLVIPKEIRRQAGLKAGAELEIRAVNGHVEIEPAYARVRLVDQDGWLVAVPEDPNTPKLTVEDVNRLIEEIRDERFRELLGEPE